MTSEYSITNGWSKPVPVPVVTTGVEALGEQIRLISRSYYDRVSHMSDDDQAYMDGIIHWLVEIQESFKESDVVMLEERGE